MDFNIPLEIKDKAAFPQLKKVDRQVVCAAVLMGLSNQDAFKLYHPEYLTADGRLNDAGKKANTMFWNYGKTKDYREAYESELAEFLGRKSKNTSVDLGEDVSDADKAKALRAMYRYVIDNSIKIDDLDDPTILLKIADKMRFFDQLEDKQESPRRYLPERCSACLYKSFVESHVESGEIENACLRCKALFYAKNNGFRYDPTNILEPIKESENDKEKDKTE